MSAHATYEQNPDPRPHLVNEQDIEAGFVEKLRDLKYTDRPDIRDRASLEKNFRQKFEALNRVRLKTWGCPNPAVKLARSTSPAPNETNSAVPQARHPGAASFVRQNLFAGVVTFTELEARIAALAELSPSS